ncbi:MULTISPECIES: cytochrome c oxidase subunit II [Rhizobium]|uniref:cytochrome c oxidase subunit II n=1 Tax=Rhizobium TaxID=379 RepID=UPI00103E9DB3|nr:MULTISPECIES: cytochrome c oxidase subunit II [Rhizobium]MBY4593252.1 cytochrome c oxidase subunit II [Rhizobium redzepovicii]MBY4617949.1 cytochrome c oxidase subunit II [Rhizobium redzepovicii]TBY42981.1 cytochrome c oxidase subunit II [Rhizobium leguminosarum bv. viciae]ULJ81669.1 cytochrome c oxidase subunit II [Rhizobium sp. C104]
MFVVAGLTACAGSQSALDVHGASAIHLKHLMLSVIFVCALVWIAVMLVLAYALFRKRRDPAGVEAGGENRATLIVSAAVGATALIITGLTVASFFTTRLIDADGEVAMTIAVKGEQWWWRVTYMQDGAPDFETANEIHIPVGRTVLLQLESADVIHSFWIPSLAGKQDLVPGRTNMLAIRAETAGVYRGQCAEFCGLQHSHMAVQVVADDPGSFERWLADQRAKSLEPAEPEAAVGQAVFLEKPCAACHRVRGTPSAGTTGPDLTHVGSRVTIAAGVLERTRGSLAAWIADPQTLKPGNNMPMVPLTSDELRSVSAYMESLK